MFVQREWTGLKEAKTLQRGKAEVLQVRQLAVFPWAQSLFSQQGQENLPAPPWVHPSKGKKGQASLSLYSQE